MIDQIKKAIYSSAPFKALNAELGQPEIHVRGISGSLMAFVAGHILEQRELQLLLVVPDEDSCNPS